MKTALKAGAATLAALCALAASPAAAFECDPAVTQRSMEVAHGFVESAKNDHLLGDRVAEDMRARAEKYMTERYIQYHPGVESGREPFVQFHIKWYRDNPPQPPKNPGAPNLDTIVAQCDIVLYVHPIPRIHEGKAYMSYLFDMWRMMDGKTDEHWDSFYMPWDQSAAGNEAPEGEGWNDGDLAAVPLPVPPSKGSLQCDARQIANNRALVGRLMGAAQGRAKAVAADVIAPDFAEYNPLLAAPEFQGRKGFIRAAEKMPNAAPGATLRYGMPEFVFADCDHVATVKKVLRYDYKAGGGKTYESYWFDLWQVKDGKLSRHWDASLRNADYHWADVDRLNLPR